MEEFILMVMVSARALKHILAGCLAAALPATSGPARAASERVVYAFKGGSDGGVPLAGLIDVGGTLYGTTVGGGNFNCDHGCGTVFKVTSSGQETVVYDFEGVTNSGSYDGAYPVAGLLDVGGTLFGTTLQGGYVGSGGSSMCDGGCGTVFAVTTAGTETVMHSFDYTDGAMPFASLINVDGTLYGTAYGGGYPGACGGCGTVFAMTTRGAVTVVYAFKGGKDGANPSANLLNVGGTLFGTTTSGGGAGGSGSGGFGTVFAMTTAGAETVVHAFQGGSDGAYPDASLIDVGGALIGTTGDGGGYGIEQYDGTVFKVAMGKTEKVVYAFEGGSDGANPDASLIRIGGTLYGTTSHGGGSPNCYGGCGTVFAITAPGVDRVLYSFQGSSDGAYPNASLLNVGGTLYGTTSNGGASNNGTVFAVKP